MYSKLINEHQNAILGFYYNFHGLKHRLEKDEKVINNLGNNLANVIQFLVDTDNLINELIN